MEIQFYKYQGTGNDFIIIDDRQTELQLKPEVITRLCDRNFGIGSDGLILIRNHPKLDFEMVFYNPDASQSFCGNGSRCAVRFAHTLGMFENETHFLSTDGEHEASLLNSDWVSLKMHDVKSYQENGNDLIINTGSPHYIVSSVPYEEFDLIPAARIIRYSDRFKKEGINVNFIRSEGEFLRIRTYERGVEDETLSCGTGVTAAALAQHIFKGKKEGQFIQKIRSQGGELEVAFECNSDGFSEIYLKGSAKPVFEGLIQV